MIAVIFEIWPKPGQKQRYLDLAAELRPLLDTIDGFISIERFESLYEPGKLLSLSFTSVSTTSSRAKRAVNSTVCCQGTSGSCTPWRIRTGQPVSIIPSSSRCLRPSSMSPRVMG